MDWKAKSEERDFLSAKEFAHFLKSQKEHEAMSEAL
jgi:hypothetical protein